METTNRPTAADLAAQLEETPFRFDFFRAVRLLETRHVSLARIGTSHDPREDPIRFGQNLPWPLHLRLWNPLAQGKTVSLER